MQRLYSLYEIVAPRQYRRLSELAFTKPVAVRVFQNALLAYCLGDAALPRCLRPVPAQKGVANHG